MNLDDLLHDTLRDDRWALPVPAGTLDAVRRQRRRRQRLTVAASSVAALALVGGTLSIATLVQRPTSALSPYATGGVPPGSAAPGITPAFVPTSGRDWLLTRSQAATFWSTHTQPSPPPGQSTVASPAPLASQSAELEVAVRAADYPAGTTFRREDSVGGQPDVAGVHIALPGGVKVYVETSQLSEPFAWNGSDEANDVKGATLVDVPGTDSAAVLEPAANYGLPGTTGDPVAVLVISRGGVSTYWVAPRSVSLDQLKAWAFAAAQQG